MTDETDEGTRTEYAVRVYWEDGEVETFPRNAESYARAFAGQINHSGGLVPPHYEKRRQGRAVVLTREVSLPPWKEME